MIIGTRMRLTMNAGKSSADRGGLAQSRGKGQVEWKVGSSVAMPRIISTSFITGTGFMKCMPMNFSGRSVRRQAG